MPGDLGANTQGAARDWPFYGESTWWVPPSLFLRLWRQGSGDSLSQGICVDVQGERRDVGVKNRGRLRLDPPNNSIRGANPASFHRVISFDLSHTPDALLPGMRLLTPHSSIM
jgi:hypothetical protein